MTDGKSNKDSEKMKRLVFVVAIATAFVCSSEEATMSTGNKRDIKKPFVVKGFYLGMSVGEARSQLAKIDPTRSYRTSSKGVVDPDMNPVDDPDKIVAIANDGQVQEFVFSRRLVDKLFNAKGVTCEQLCSGMSSAYQQLGDVKKKIVMVPDWKRRTAAARAIKARQMEMLMQVNDSSEIDGLVNKLREDVAAIKTTGVCYYWEGNGFVLEITPSNGNEDEQSRFFVLRSTKAPSKLNFD